jgi:hypothetical protein
MFSINSTLADSKYFVPTGLLMVVLSFFLPTFSAYGTFQNLVEVKYW